VMGGIAPRVGVDRAELRGGALGHHRARADR
jgi:hypothetical protein